MEIVADLHGDRARRHGSWAGPAGRQRNDLSVARNATNFVQRHHRSAQELTH